MSSLNFGHVLIASRWNFARGDQSDRNRRLKNSTATSLFKNHDPLARRNTHTLLAAADWRGGTTFFYVSLRRRKNAKRKFTTGQDDVHINAVLWLLTLKKNNLTPPTHTIFCSLSPPSPAGGIAALRLTADIFAAASAVSLFLQRSIFKGLIYDKRPACTHGPTPPRPPI